MAAQGQLGQVPRSPRRRAAEAIRTAWGAGRHFARAAMDMPASLSGSDGGVAARVRQRVRALGLADADITVESWRGEVTLRGKLSEDQAQLLASELSRVRGVMYVNNFLRP